jgi:hypothetical protein
MVGAIAVVVRIIGTATGSAYVMLGMSVTAIILLVVFYRRNVGAGAILAAFVAAVTRCHRWHRRLHALMAGLLGPG